LPGRTEYLPGFAPGVSELTDPARGEPLVAASHASLLASWAAGGILPEKPQASGGAIFVVGTRWPRRRSRAAEQQRATANEVGFPHAIREQPKVPDPNEAPRQHVEQKATSELGARQVQALRSVAMNAIAPEEADLLAVVFEDAGVGKGDLAGVAGDVAQNLLGPGEGSLGVDHPALAGGTFEQVSPEGARDG